MNMSMAAQSCWHCWHCPQSLQYKLKMSIYSSRKRIFFFFFSEHNSCGFLRLKAPSVPEKITDDDISSSRSPLFKDIKHFMSWAQIDMHELKPVLDDLFSPEFLLVPLRLLILPLEQEGCLIEKPEPELASQPTATEIRQDLLFPSRIFERSQVRRLDPDLDRLSASRRLREEVLCLFLTIQCMSWHCTA